MSRSPTLPTHHKLRLQSHFGFTRVPFNKNMRALDMFDSRQQRELLRGLLLWSQVGGLALVVGPTGVGKSITVRRFLAELDDARFRILHLASVPTTPTGFLRTVNRALSLPMRLHAADLFEQAQQHLTNRNADDGPHPLLVLDDAEGLSVELLDVARRLTSYALDAEDRFSILITGTDDLLRTLRDPRLQPLCSRIGYARPLRPFTLEDARNYVTFHVSRAEGPKDLFSDAAAGVLFHASLGTPRSINQIALQALIQAAVEGRDTLDGPFVEDVINAHPLYAGGTS